MDALSLVALALSMGGAPEPGKDIHTDYIRAASTKAAYSFECGKTRTLLRVAEEIRPRGGSGKLADRWRIRLLDLDVKGRRIPARQMEKAAQALNRYSWLTRVQGRCTAGGTVSLWIEGMPAQAWADFAESKLPARPATAATTVEIAPTGEVEVR